MAISEKLYRESCQRLHRIIANFFAMKAWCSGADCIVIDRVVLERLLDLERIKRKRVNWIEEDMKPWFPYISTLFYSDKDSVGVLYLSRKEIENLMSDSMSDEKRIQVMEKEGVKACLFKGVEDIDWSESALLTEMTLLSSGLKIPRKNRKIIRKAKSASQDQN